LLPQAASCEIIVRFASGNAIPYTIKEDDKIGDFKKTLLAKEALEDVEVCFFRRKKRKKKEEMELFCL
jgi:hypothetical protein